MARSAASYILMLDEQSSQAQNVLHTFVCLTRQRRARHKVLHKNAFSDLARRSKAKTAEALGVHTSYVRRFLRLALLAPPIVDAIFAGKAPWTLSLTKLDTSLPYSWKEQMELFGMV